jgi:hypothetical protein
MADCSVRAVADGAPPDVKRGSGCASRVTQETAPIGCRSLSIGCYEDLRRVLVQTDRQIR